MDRELHTPRLWLRAPRPGDAQAVFERWAQDHERLRYLNWRPHSTLRQTEAQLNWDMACWGKHSRWVWLLLPHGESAPVGQVELTPQAGAQPPHHLRLGYVLARSHQGRGLMREALTAVQAHAFAQAAVWRLDALCDVDNLASQRLLQALGWACEGVLARHSHHPLAGPEPRDVRVYAVVRPTFRPAPERPPTRSGAPETG